MEQEDELDLPETTGCQPVESNDKFFIAAFFFCKSVVSGKISIALLVSMCADIVFVNYRFLGWSNTADFSAELQFY